MRPRLPSRWVIAVLAVVVAGLSLFGLSACGAAHGSPLTTATVVPATSTSVFGQANIQVTYRSPFDEQTNLSATPYLGGARDANTPTPTPSPTDVNTSTPRPTIAPPTATPVPPSPVPTEPTLMPLTSLMPTNTPADAVLEVAMNTSYSASAGVSAPLQQDMMQRMADTPRAHLRTYLNRVFDWPGKASLWNSLAKTLMVLQFVSLPEPKIVVPAAPVVVNPPADSAPAAQPPAESHSNPAPPPPEPPRQEPPPPPPEQPPPPPPPPPEEPPPPPPPPEDDGSGSRNDDNKSGGGDGGSGNRNPDDSSGSRNDHKSGSGS